VQRDENWLF
jgi:Ca2+-binding EF-hand superfamily protein